MLDPSAHCPASSVAPVQVGSFRDGDAVLSFASGLDVLTVEIEHVDVEALERVAQSAGAEVQPSPAALRIIQDKFAQKQHLAARGVEVGPFADVPDRRAAVEAGARFGYPFILKAKRYGRPLGEWGAGEHCDIYFFRVRVRVRGGVGCVSGTPSSPPCVPQVARG